MPGKYVVRNCVPVQYDAKQITLNEEVKDNQH